MSACGHASGHKREARRAREASASGGGAPREKRKRFLRHGTAVAIVAAVGLLYERGVTPVAQAVAAQPSIADLPTHVVHIDAIALDGRGRVVDDLKPADFELREDEALRPVES